MKVRFDMIERVQEQAKQGLIGRKDDKAEYKLLLKGLIKQGLIRLLEEKVEVRCLRCDEQIVAEVLAESQREFNEMCEVQSEISINKQNWLNEDDLGGVTLTSFNGRIVCDNTLRARLAYCLQLLLPTIRNMLFSESDEYLIQRRL